MANVKIYSTPTCVYCKMAKDFFVKNSVQYQEFNVAEDDAAREEMIQKSHQLGEIFVGFDQKGLTRALKIKT